MKDIFKRLIRAKVDWQEVAGNPHLQASFEGKTATLKFNDWPDEVMCTISLDGDEQDWEDFPSNWTLPGHREKLTDSGQN